jgi:glyoxylase-like metal-dependent hydrolase (beta-lactamase superfamily II)
MKILSTTGGMVDTNSYLLIDERTNTAAIIDAPDHTVEPFIKHCQENKLNLTQLILTHGHWDHIADHDVVTRAFPDAKVIIHKIDEPKLQRPGSLMWELPFSITPRNADDYYADGDIHNVGGIKLKVMHTPGHSVGHVCLFFDDPQSPVLFAGDLLMAGTVGRYDFPGDGDLHVLIESLKRVMKLPDSTRVLAGHGPPTTIGNERNGNPFLHEHEIV